MKSLRITPSDGSSVARSTSKLFSGLSLRSSRSNLTNATTMSEEDVVVTDDFGVEVCITRDAATLHELALHEYKMHRLEEAIDCWNQALCQQPDDAKILFYLLKTQLEQKELEPSKVNKDEVKRYFEKLRPHLSIMAFPEASPLVLDLFVEKEEWEAAVKLASRCKVDPRIMARIHYEVGIQESVSTSARMDCMAKCLACRPENRLKLAAHAELVQLHTASGNYLQALEHHEERLVLLENKGDIAKAFYEEAELYVSLGHKEKAMHALEKGLELYPTSLTLLEAKADLYYLLGHAADSLELHEAILKQTDDASEQTKLLYTMGRIAHKSGLRDRAVEYYQRELKITQATWGEEHLECSRIYHELARLADEACDYELALSYLSSALNIEKLHQKASGDRQISLLIKETQKLMGKIYYKTGDFERALKASFGNEL